MKNVYVHYLKRDVTRMSLRKLNDAIVIVVMDVRELQNVATNCVIIVHVDTLYKTSEVSEM